MDGDVGGGVDTDLEGDEVVLPDRIATSLENLVFSVSDDTLLEEEDVDDDRKVVFGYGDGNNVGLNLKRDEADGDDG